MSDYYDPPPPQPLPTPPPAPPHLSDETMAAVVSAAVQAFSCAEDPATFGRELAIGLQRRNLITTSQSTQLQAMFTER